jgi:hypothetical protein
MEAWIVADYAGIVAYFETVSAEIAAGLPSPFVAQAAILTSRFRSDDGES